jgi:hypothetical protein
MYEINIATTGVATNTVTLTRHPTLPLPDAFQRARCNGAVVKIEYMGARLNATGALYLMRTPPVPVGQDMNGLLSLYMTSKQTTTISVNQLLNKPAIVYPGKTGDASEFVRMDVTSPWFATVPATADQYAAPIHWPYNQLWIAGFGLASDAVFSITVKSYDEVLTVPNTILAAVAGPGQPHDGAGVKMLDDLSRKQISNGMHVEIM